MMRGAMDSTVGAVRSSLGGENGTPPPKYDVHGNIFRGHIGQTLSVHRACLRIIPKKIKAKQESRTGNLKLAKRKDGVIELKENALREFATQNIAHRSRNSRGKGQQGGI
eukprot:scaffold5479_cov199-Amphora_coffeaeformis.AAC.14